MSTTEVLATDDPGARLGARLYFGADGNFFGPAAHLAEERRRLAAARWNHFDAQRLGATIGAVISGVDLRVEQPQDVIDELRAALLAYKVIFFRDQPITAEQHVAFARRFGELEVHPFIPGNTGVPELVRFEKGADVAGYENSWHHDVTWRDIPSMGAILHGVEIPDIGGDTLFADMYAAYDGLPDDVKARIDLAEASHDFMRAFSRQVPEERREEMRAKYPLQYHPVVPRHAETGRRHLYVNKVFTSAIVGLDPDESAELLAFLYMQANRPEYQCRFTWEADSIAFWDNRAAQHYAASDYWPDRRVMERASIVGSRPTR